jgi:CysZ protein
MAIFKQFGNGVSIYIKAIELVFSSNLWIYFLYPIVIYALTLIIGVTFLDDLISKFLGLFSFGLVSMPHWISWLADTFSVILSFFLRMYLFYFYATISKYITLILMSPVMAALSMRTEMIITGNKYQVDGKQFFKDVLRGIAIALRNMMLQLLLLILSLVIVWIPIVGWVSPILVLIISFYFYGFSMIDYVNERRRRLVNQSIQYIRKNKGLAIGNGFIFTLLFNIPIVGLMLATVLSPVAACIAVLNSETET